MPATVVLLVVAGEDPGQALRFSERSTCIAGRDGESNIVIREQDSNGRYISRRHFMLDINPPLVMVRDLGSRSGTYVRRIVEGKLQETLIGKRTSGSSGEVLLEGSGEQTLRHGDEIRAHNTIYRVSVSMACDDCGADMGPRTSVYSAVMPGALRCATCQRIAAAQHERLSQEPATLPPQGAGLKEPQEFLFDTRTMDPLEIAKALLQDAARGDRQLVAIEGYHIIKELGRGGFGCVCLAEHLRTGEHVALKVLRPDQGITSRTIKLFRLEADQTKALRHSNVVSLYDHGCSRGTLFFTSEFCEMGSVAALMKKLGSPLSLEVALDIILQALDGLDYAHHVELPNVRLADGSVVTAHGLVHRDVKPGNIFLKRIEKKLVAKLGDYGLAKAFDFAGLTGRTSSGMAEGTPSFMPRQQALHFRYVEPDVDVWAMAASLYFMLTACTPRHFSPPTEDVWHTVLKRAPIPIRRDNSKIPKKLAEIIDFALDDRRELHFATAKDLKNALLGTR